jgi:DNA-3-methyladenine glycosylase II
VATTTTVTVRTSELYDHAEAVAALVRADKHLARLVQKVGDTKLVLDECKSPYESLLEAIVYQSISGKAAATIYERVKALGKNGQCPMPEEILRLKKSELRKAGLSFAKIAAVRDLAQKTIDAVVPTIDEARKMSDAELVERLDSVRGVGPWTVEMFLIFRLGRPDVLPIHDYGVQKGFALTYGKRAIPKPKELLKFGERWRPYRTVASWYMWRAVQMAGKDARKITKVTKKRLLVKRGARRVSASRSKTARRSR